MLTSYVDLELWDLVGCMACYMSVCWDLNSSPRDCTECTLNHCPPFQPMFFEGRICFVVVVVVLVNPIFDL